MSKIDKDFVKTLLITHPKEPVRMVIKEVKRISNFNRKIFG